MIHLFKRGGLPLVLDVGSGAVHMLDDVSYALLSQLTEEQLRTEKEPVAAMTALESAFSHTQLKEALAELRQLAGQGLLFSSDDYSGFQDTLGVAPVKAMCLHIAHDCNLRCRYCFASTGNFGGSRDMMSFAIAKKAIDLLVELSGNRRNLEVDFFGGEPLMNFEVVRKTTQYARELEQPHKKNFRFTITTNGIALTDERIADINREMGNVVLSIDGRKEINDAMRPTVNGKGSFDLIVPKFQKLVKERGDKEYYARGTYTRHNLDFDRDVLELYRLGFKQISVEPVVGPDEDEYSIRAQDIPIIEQSYERLMAELLEGQRAGKKPFNFFHFMVDLENGPCAIKRLKGCGSGNEYLAVTPDGELYPCHQFVGKEEFLMGSVDTGITNQSLRKTFADANLLHKSACRDCWAKYFCSGGCNANNHAFEGSLLTPHKISCELEKIRLECAITLHAASCQV